jgi:hypothetical protein
MNYITKDIGLKKLINKLNVKEDLIKLNQNEIFQEINTTTNL